VQSRWRWVNLASLFLALVASAGIMVSMASVSKVVASAYGVSELLVNSATISFFLLFVFVNFPSVNALEAGTQGYGMMVCVSSKIHSS